MIAKSRKNKKRRYQDIASSIFFALLILFGAGFLIYSNWKINQRREELISQINKLEEEIKQKEEQNLELQAGVSQVSTEEYLEKEAREKLGLKKPGEEVVSVQKVETEENKAEAGEQESNISWNPKTWWNWIKSKFK